MAGCGVPMPHGHERRWLTGTDAGRKRTARAEGATDRQRRGARHLAVEQSPPPAFARVRRGNGTNEGLGIRMRHRGEDRADRPLLDDSPRYITAISSAR